MILSDRDLILLIELGDMEVQPYVEANVEPCSIDLTLADAWVHNPRHGWYLEPGEFALGCTVERVRLPPYLAAFVCGKSSLGRQGLFIENAGLVDPGFDGEITLELYNASRLPVRLVPGMKICQLIVQRLTSPAAKPYGHPDRKSKYQHQRGVTAARPEKP